MGRCKMLTMLPFFFLVLGVALSSALPSAAISDSASVMNFADSRGFQSSRNAIQNGEDLMGNMYADCTRKDSMSCLKYKLFTFVDKVLNNKDTFRLAEGITVVKTGISPEITGDGAPRSLVEEVKTQDVEDMIISRVEKFMHTHTLKVDVKGDDVMNAVSTAGRALVDTLGLTQADTNSVGEERGKKKKAQKILLPLLMALKLKMVALIPLALGGIALIAGKALLVGKIALVLASIIGLKKLLSQQQKTVTYEIVSHPHHSSHDSFSSGGGDIGGGGYGPSGGGGGHGGWGRSTSELDTHKLAYRGYTHNS